MSCDFDVVIIGAGAAGLMAAGVAGQRGCRVLVLDHAPKLAEKIRISGGGRCNFTNLYTSPERFLSSNPQFTASVLARYTARDFVALVKRHGIRFHEKHRGQLFCDDSSEQIIGMLLNECRSGGVEIRLSCKVHSLVRDGQIFKLMTDQGQFHSPQLIIATGGLSIPKIGASDFGYRIAKQFGLQVVEPYPGLVPLSFSAEIWRPFLALAGIALPVSIGTQNSSPCFDEDLLLTHRGLSGPAVLQISSYWRPGDALIIDLAPGINLEQALLKFKNQSRVHFANALAQLLPKNLAHTWLEQSLGKDAALAQRKIAEIPNRLIASVAGSLNHWQLSPNGSEGWRKAEVTCGGVDTRELDQATLQAHQVSGLYFIGEVVDVTGWLGGYNFQWAWASGVTAGLAVSTRSKS